MDVRSVEEWKRVLGGLPSPEGTPVEQVVATRVLSALDGYREGSRHHRRDAEELANAMKAWAEMNVEVLSPPRHPSAEVPAVYRDGRDRYGNDV